MTDDHHDYHHTFTAEAVRIIDDALEGKKPWRRRAKRMMRDMANGMYYRRWNGTTYVPVKPPWEGR